MNLFNVTNHDEDPISLKVIKEYSCTFLCFNRPKVRIIYTEDGQDMDIGKIEDEYDFCNYNFNVMNESGEKRYKIHASCCQCGIQLAGCCCEKCETVKFEVFDASGTMVTTLMKKNKNCLKACLTDMDNFGIEFTSNMDWKDRTLLLMSTMFIDFMMFEERGGPGSQGGAM